MTMNLNDLKARNGWAGIEADLFKSRGRCFLRANVKGRAFGSSLARGFYPLASTAELDARAKPGALTRDGNTRLSAAEADPQTKPGAPAAAPAAMEKP